MKKQTMSIVRILSFLVTLAVVSIHASSPRLFTVTVPFDFTVGKTMLPAGKYTVERAEAHGVLLIYSGDRQASAGITTISVEAREIPKQAKLEFRHYGSEYFLARVWEQGDRTGRALAPSRRERNLARHLASNGLKPEIVSITAE
jgi:hypothetical protein